MPKVSILVPNLNNASYLVERFETILAQTWQDFEVIVCDSYSNDGAWDIIQRYARKDTRIKACQVPKAGIYAGWNECLKRAQGEYIYMATSDDTMLPDCLAVLATQLEKNPDCGLAMCGLSIINSHGQPLAKGKQWLDYPAGVYFGDLWLKPHKRLAPLDGVLSATLHCIWHSATQLLIRRSVYQKHGNYRTDLGSIADFEWNARVGFHENVIYTPHVLATLRVHQASSSVQRGGYSMTDMDHKLVVLDTLLSDLVVKNPTLSSNLRSASWPLAFKFQKWIYSVRVKPLCALRCAVAAFLRKPFLILSILPGLIIAFTAGKETIRAFFTKRLLRKLRMSQSALISNH